MIKFVRKLKIDFPSFGIWYVKVRGEWGERKEWSLKHLYVLVLAMVGSFFWGRSMVTEESFKKFEYSN